jgi:NADPH:quinone reductase-like Zn-dependent oxidoreductase
MAKVFKLIGIGLGTLVLLLVLGALLAVGYTASCPSTPVFSGQGAGMKAVVYRCYGGPEVLEYADIPKPVPADDQLLVKVYSAGVNPLDWHYMRGSPYLMRLMSGIGAPASTSMGVDFAGVVEAVGKGVTKFKPGDAVFGGADGSFADYVVVGENKTVALKPDNISFEQAGSVAIAAATAIQALRDKGQLKAGQKVLINGASGGVGTFAVQIAKFYGAQVTGVCSTRNLEMVRSIGADHVIDYTREDYTRGDERYDLIIDNVGNHSLIANAGVMVPEGILVMLGGGSGNWIGPILRPVSAMFVDLFVEQSFMGILGELNQAEMNTLADLMQRGVVTPVIERSYPLADAAQAMAHSESGRVRGKIVISNL